MYGKMFEGREYQLFLQLKRKKVDVWKMVEIIKEQENEGKEKLERQRQRGTQLGEEEHFDGFGREFGYKDEPKRARRRRKGARGLGG